MRSKRPLNRFAGVAAAVLAICAFAAPARQAAAQAVWASISNQFIMAELGESGTENNNPVPGRLRVTDVTTGNIIMFGPTVDRIGTGGGVNIPGSFITIRIDGGVPNGGWDLIFGDQTTGTWIGTPPVALDGRIFARWATVPGTVATKPVPPIQVSVEISLVHDVVCYKITVFNGIVDTLPPTPASAAHTIGVRMAQNYTTDGNGNEGPVFTPTAPQICTDTELDGSLVPAFWQHFDNTGANPIGGILKPIGADITFITPDIFRVTDGNLVFDLWEHAPNNIPGFNICTDSWDADAGVYWNPHSLSPGESKDFITYFGRQDTSIDFGRPWFAGVSGPVNLTFNPAATPMLSPNPFAVTAFITNAFTNDLSHPTLQNVQATISLPKGLVLAPGESATKTAAPLPNNGEDTFTWNVVPDGTASGVLTYAVAFSATVGSSGTSQGKVVTRTIDIPALPNQQFLSGLQMVSFPYLFDDPTPSVALGLQSTNFALLRWDPTLGQYTAVSQILPGQGYWLNLPSSTTINLQGAHPVPTGAAFTIVLQNGWNQIGSPWLVPINWADVQVITTDQSDPSYGKTLTPDEAQNAGLIESTLFRYDPATQSYVFDMTTNTDLTPFVGYWIHALRTGVELLIPPPSPNRAMKRTRAVSSAAPSLGSGGWQLALVATSKGVTDAHNYIGVSAGVKSALNQIQKPPFSANGTGLTIVGTDAKGRAATLARDIRPAHGGRMTWNVTVRTGSPNQDVTVTWPDISKLPRNYQLYVTDGASGNRTSMRQTGSLQVNTGSAATRSLTITAESRAVGGGLVILPTVRAVPGSRAAGMSAAVIDVTTTADATIRITIKSGSGKVIRNLATGRAATSGGTQSETWDLRDNKGTPVPAGTYLIEVKGTTSGGQSSSGLTTYTVVR